jgi:hypothetical protein
MMNHFQVDSYQLEYQLQHQQAVRCFILSLTYNALGHSIMCYLACEFNS